MIAKTLFSVSTALSLVSCGSLEALEQKDFEEFLAYLENKHPPTSKIAANAIPATVSIKVQIAPQYDARDLFGFNDDFFRHFFGPNFFGQRPVEPQPQTAGGSGFLVTKDGYLVTNYHVIKDASQIMVLLHDGREFPATVKGSDPRTDLAVLKIDEDSLPYLVFGDSDALKVADKVVAIGAPFGLEATVTDGIVSAKGRQDLGTATWEDYIQTNAAINPGNSGGPLLNEKGEVIGVNSAILSRTGGYMGIAFSIPSNMARHVVDQILNEGSVKRAYLGVVLQPIDQTLSDALDLGKQDGILVAEIAKDSAAAKGGLLQGDIILEYNGKLAKNVTKLRNEIGLMEPGQTIHLKILRNHKILSLSIPLGSQNDPEVVSTELTKKIGIEVENLTQELAGKLSLPSDTEGIVISKVKPGSPAHAAGLKSSFLITAVAGSVNEPKPIKNIADFNAALKELKDRKHVLLIVRHQHYQRYYSIKLG
jgi:serine protease Do